MEAKDYLKYIVHEIHTTIVATVDDDGLPVTAAMSRYPFAEKSGSSDMTGSRNSLKRTLTCIRSTQRKNL